MGTVLADKWERVVGVHKAHTDCMIFDMLQYVKPDLALHSGCSLRECLEVWS